MIPIKRKRRNPNTVKAKRRRAKEIANRDMTHATTQAWSERKRQRAIAHKERVAALKAAHGK